MAVTPNPNPAPQEPVFRAAGPRLGDLLADLLWPKLIQAAPLALRPSRLLVALLMLAASFAIGEVAQALVHQPNIAGFLYSHVAGAVNGIAVGIIQLKADVVLGELESLVSLSAPRLWERYGFASILLGLPILLVWAIGGCAISRMAACEFSQGVMVPFRAGVRFAIQRTGSLLLAVLLPFAVAAFIAGIMAGLGWLALGIEGARAFGAIAYGVFLLLAALAVLTLGCYLVSLPLLIPAVACEGTDGLDAIQRSFAYVLGRPLRLVIYGLVALLCGWLVMMVLNLLADATVGFAGWASTLLAGPEARDIAAQASAQSGPRYGLALSKETTLTDSAANAAQVIRYWTVLPKLVVGSFAVSYLFSASSVLYLLIRQVHDGQDASDLWMPGMVEGTMAEALRARAALSGVDPIQAGKMNPRAAGDETGDS